MNVRIQVLQGPDSNMVVELQQPTIVVGRGLDCDVVLKDPKVSRKHFQIIVGEQEIVIQKVAPQNYLLLNGRPVDFEIVTQEVTLQLGDTLLKVLPLGLRKPSVLTPNSVGQKPSVRDASEGVLNRSSPTPLEKPNLGPATLTKPLGSSGLPGNHSKVNDFSGPEPQNQQIQKVLMVGIVAVVGIAGFWFLQRQKSSSIRKKGLELRTNIVASQQLQAESKRSETEREKEQKKRLPAQSKAQEFFLKGFRDYRNGNYSRAIENFGAALALDPNHSASRRYLILSQRRFREFIQMHFETGKRYHGMQNYRLCLNHFGVVLKTLKEENDPQRQEALFYYKECKAKLEDNF